MFLNFLKYFLYAILISLAGFSIYVFSLVALDNIIVAKAQDSDLLGDSANNDIRFDAVVNTVFGTIQFAIAVLSGTVIAFSILLSILVGKSMRELRENTTNEVKELTYLYRENLKAEASREIGELLASSGDWDEQIRATRSEIEDAKLNIDEARQIAETYKIYKDASDDLEADYTGPYYELQREYGQEFEDKVPRPRVRQALSKLEEGGLLRAVSASDCFNGAQSAARISLKEDAHRLAAIARWLDPQPLYIARTLRSQFEAGNALLIVESEGKTSIIRDKDVTPDEARTTASQSAIDMLSEPQANYIVYSEVWNIAVEDDLPKFLEKISILISKFGATIPSYLDLLACQGLTISLVPDWRSKAIVVFESGIEKLRLESRKTSWYENSIRQAKTSYDALKSGLKPETVEWCEANGIAEDSDIDLGDEYSVETPQQAFESVVKLFANVEERHPGLAGVIFGQLHAKDGDGGIDEGSPNA